MFGDEGFASPWPQQRYAYAILLACVTLLLVTCTVNIVEISTHDHRCLGHKNLMQ